MNYPLVSVICLSYNHEKYIREAIESILLQQYEPIEIILVDDNSADRTCEFIDGLISQKYGIKKIYLKENIGNCKAFNLGFRESSGDFIIDLAGDDVLLSERIRIGVETFNRYGNNYGVHFTDAIYINEHSNIIGYHYKRDMNGKLLKDIPQGDIYHELLSRYFICTPTMMIRRKVLEDLNGYDENLSYEDFDFWIRSSRIYKYCYTDQRLMKKRVLKDSLSKKQYIKNSEILESTYKVCLKAENLNQNKREKYALVRRSRYEFRQALISGNFYLAKKFASLIQRNTDNILEKYFFVLFSQS